MPFVWSIGTIIGPGKCDGNLKVQMETGVNGFIRCSDWRVACKAC